MSMLLAFAEQCIDAEQLGQRDVSDMLTISFSSNDLVGHTFGPDSQEVFDIIARSDRVMAELLSFLDDRVGKGNYTMIVTPADHGICSMPEVTVAKKVDPNAVPRRFRQAPQSRRGDAHGEVRQAARQRRQECG